MTKERLAGLAGKAGRVAVAAAMALALAPAVALTVPAEEAQALAVTAADGSKWECTPYKEQVTDDGSGEVMTGVSASYLSGGGEDVTVPATFKWGDKEYPVRDVNGFDGHTEVKSVAVPETVTEVSSTAFRGCSSLQRVSGLRNVKVVRARAFQGCSSLASLDLSAESVEQIGKVAFDGCPYSFQSPYLVDCWDGERSLTAMAEVKGYMHRSVAGKVLELLNKERAKAGAEPLAADAGLNDFAELRSMDITLNYEHSYAMFKEARDDPDYTAENIGAGYVDNVKDPAKPDKIDKEAKEVLEHYLAEPLHRESILDPKGKYVGIGVFCDENLNGEVTSSIQVADGDYEKEHVASGSSYYTGVKRFDKKVEVKVNSLNYTQENYLTPRFGAREVAGARKGDFDIVSLIPYSGARWSSSDTSVATVSKTNGCYAHVKLHKAGKFTITCKWPTTRGKEISYSMEYTSKLKGLETFTDANGTVYTQIAKGKKELAVTGFTDAAKKRGSVTVNVGSIVDGKGAYWKVRKIANGALKGTKAKTLKLWGKYGPGKGYLTSVKGSLAGSKIKTVQCVSAERLSDHLDKASVKKELKQAKKDVTKLFSKKSCGKKVKVKVPKK